MSRLAVSAEARLQLPHVIAVDGPSASGKGTLSRRLSATLGYTYVDTGAMYRTLAWWALQKGLRCEKPMNDAAEAAIVTLMRRWKAEMRIVEGQAWLHVEGYFPAKEIRTDVVEKAVPVIAQISKVRDWMVAEQRNCVRFGPLVMEGRDIGTEVFPLAPVKFFLEADEGVRQARMAERGNAGSNAALRDSMDTTRKKGALYAALDSIRINNTGQTPDETFAILMEHVRTRLSLP
jgi:cytidylate kinase